MHIVDVRTYKVGLRCVLIRVGLQTIPMCEPKRFDMVRYNPQDDTRGITDEFTKNVQCQTRKIGSGDMTNGTERRTH